MASGGQRLPQEEVQHVAQVFSPSQTQRGEQDEAFSAVCLCVYSLLVVICSSCMCMYCVYTRTWGTGAALHLAGAGGMEWHGGSLTSVGLLGPVTILMALAHLETSD